LASGYSAGADSRESDPSWSRDEGEVDSRLAELLRRLESIQDRAGGVWHETSTFVTGQDHSHWIRNVMEMVSSSPDDRFHQLCMLDLSDVLFKIVDGEKKRLVETMTSSGRYSSAEDMERLPTLVVAEVGTVPLPRAKAHAYGFL